MIGTIVIILRLIQLVSLSVAFAFQVWVWFIDDTRDWDWFIISMLWLTLGCGSIARGLDG